MALNESRVGLDRRFPELLLPVDLTKVSDEAADYRPELSWLVEQLGERVADDDWRLAAAEEAGAAVQVVSNPVLGFDLDTPDDQWLHTVRDALAEGITSGTRSGGPAAGENATKARSAGTAGTAHPGSHQRAQGPASAK